MILTEGVHDGIPAADYHADPCPEPSLSSSIIKAICLDSPAHAKVKHPRLSEGPVLEEEAEKFDIGTAAHAILLEGVNAVEILEFDNWRTNASKDARDQARASDRIPLLRKVWTDVEAMVSSTRRQLDQHHARPLLFTDGRPEQTLIWQEGEVWCRARVDWLRDDRAAIDDYKSTGASANPEAWSRSLFGAGHDIQVAWYLRGLRALHPRDPRSPDPQFRFVVQENYVPYALSVISLGPDAMTLAEKKILYALDVWRECLDHGRWPAYADRVCYATLPAWEESRWLSKEVGDGV